MKKVTIGLLLIMVLAATIFIVGCGSDSNDDGSSTPSVMSMVLQAVTLRTTTGVPTTQQNIAAFGCSNYDLSSLDTHTMTMPDGSQFDLITMPSGSLIASHYYVGTSTIDLGEINDPFYETIQRQWYTGWIIPEDGTTLNGTYSGQLGDKSKDFVFNQVYFMDEINENDVTTQAGENILNVTSGDTITINNQTNSNLRYYCYIYDHAASTSALSIWASGDIREIDWVSTDEFENFLETETVAPVNNTVTFTIPAGVLTTGTDTLNVNIVAVDTSTLNSDTSGSFRTMVEAESQLSIIMSGE